MELFLFFQKGIECRKDLEVLDETPAAYKVFFLFFSSFFLLFSSFLPSFLFPLLIVIKNEGYSSSDESTRRVGGNRSYPQTSYLCKRIIKKIINFIPFIYLLLFINLLCLFILPVKNYIK